MIDRAGQRDFESIVDEVRRWDASQRIELARRVLETLEPPQIAAPARRIPLDQVFGVLKTEKPAPTDEEVQQILDEERQRKFG